MVIEPHWLVRWDNAREEWLRSYPVTHEQYLRLSAFIAELIESGPPVDAISSPSDPDQFLYEVTDADADVVFVVWSVEPVIYVSAITNRS